MFRGEHVPQGKKSLGYSLTYRSTEKTLTDKEVEQDHAKVLAALQGQLGADALTPAGSSAVGRWHGSIPGHHLLSFSAVDG